MKTEYYIKGGDFANAGTASSQVKKILIRLNIDPVLVRRSVVALYEAEVNVVAHAWEGRVEVDINPLRIQIKVTDKGPGIPDIEMAMQRGFSTASEVVREMGFGAGMGLPNIEDNTDHMNITSIVNQGTELTLINNIY